MTTAPARTRLVALLLVAGTVAWRRADYFSGSLDPTIVVKGLVVVTAVVIALSVRPDRAAPRLGTGTLWFLGAFLLASLVGAMSEGALVAGVIVATRVVLVTVAVFVLLRRRSVAEVMAALSWACAVVVSVAVLTGASSLADGRLRGGAPPLSPNEVALLAGIVLVHVAWRVLQQPQPAWVYGLAAWSLSLVWLSGSRTGLFMLVLGLSTMLVLTRRFRAGLVIAALVAVAVGSVLAIGTGALVGFAERDGSGTDTLDSRFTAWRAAAVWAESAWRAAFGGGLSVKIIPVADRFRDTQPLDSSWVSALVQAGLVGLGVAFLWMVWMVRNIVVSRRPEVVLFAGLAVFLVGRSTVESGLFDATPAFLVVLVISLGVEGGTAYARRGSGGSAEAVHPVGRRRGSIPPGKLWP